MCGILCCLSPTDSKLNSFDERLERIKHRGPDSTNISVVQSINRTTFTCGFNRLAIDNVLNGEQPIDTKDWLHVHNGEFYRKDWEDTTPKESDSYRLQDMTIENAIEFPTSLNGIFAYCSYHKETETLYVGRDMFGVIPLYYVIETQKNGLENEEDTYERIWFASEAKSLIGLGDIHMFPPNTLMVCVFEKQSKINIHKHEIYPPLPTSNYVDASRLKLHNRDNDHLTPDNFFLKLRHAVAMRLQEEVPWAAALSGGLDSAIVTSLLCKQEEDDTPERVKTFSIGLKTSKELEVAKRIGDHFGMHHGITVTVEEALEAVPSVIWALETYDVTTIRAGVMNYLLAKKMKLFGTKVVYSGEGSDEVFGGYLYFHHCPSAEEMQKELIRKLKELCYYDCLRCNKAFAAWGIECRVPFLDRSFVESAMKLNPKEKLSSTHPDKKRMEKYILRKNFQWHLEESHNACIPEHIEWKEYDTLCWRQKDQFSDSVGKEWIQALIEKANEEVSDVELEKAKELFPIQTPKTKEAYRYRKIFESQFHCSGENFVKYDNNTVACSTNVAADWCKDIRKDPTGNYVKETINKK
jgi:asparagine synthase (glutamine-hydrolysing)